MRRIVTSLYLLFICTEIIGAGTGKLAGYIKDSETGEPLIGANVVIMGENMGAASNVEGFYFINNIQPGTYTVRISMVGYQTKIFEEVRIMGDLTTELDIELAPESIQMESEVVVIADKPIVQKDLTSTQIVIQGETIVEDLRAQDVEEILQLQAGVTRGTDGSFHIRGGRTGGTVYQIDGVPVMNPLFRSQAGDLEVENIQELQAHLGTFDAEYGNAADGIVTISTKDGGDRLKIRFTYESPMLNSSPYHEKDWNLNRDDIQSLTPEQQKEYMDAVRKPDGTSAYDYISVLDDKYAEDYTLLDVLGTFSLNANGPVPFVPGLTFNSSARFRNENSQMPFGYSLYRAAGIKLTYPFSTTFKVRASYDWSQNFYQDYNHRYKYWRWFDSGKDTLARDSRYPITRNLSNRQTVSIKHALSKNTFYELIGGRIFEYSSESTPGRNVNYNENTGELVTTEYDARYLVDGTSGNFLYGDVRYWYRNRSRQYLFKGNIESQITTNHQIRSGFMLKTHEIFRHRIGMPPRANLQFFTFKPWEAAVYLQDKIEFSFMILKLGLRFDIFEPNAEEYPDPSDILETYTKPDGTADYKTVDKVPVERHYQFSPRIGLSHPISDKTSIYFAYGHFFQIPRFYDLYRDDDLQNVLVNDALVGNPGLKPEKTVSYEVGLQQQISDSWGLNVTAYSKDISNLISSFYYFVGRDYTIYINGDYGRVQGVDITLNKGYGDFYSFRFTYSLMYAVGNMSDPSEGYSNYREDEAHLRPNRNYFLDFDQRHKINAIFTLRFPKGFGPEAAGVKLLENISLTGVLTAGSGLPYTPTSRELEETNIVPEPNSARRPWKFNLDLRFSKWFTFGTSRLTLFFDVENVFDIVNTQLIWSTTGEPWYAGPNLSSPLDRQANPDNVGPRRSMRAGLIFEL